MKSIISPLTGPMDPCWYPTLTAVLCTGSPPEGRRWESGRYWRGQGRNARRGRKTVVTRDRPTWLGLRHLGVGDALQEANPCIFIIIMGVSITVDIHVCSV